MFLTRGEELEKSAMDERTTFKKIMSLLFTELMLIK